MQLVNDLFVEADGAPIFSKAAVIVSAATGSFPAPPLLHAHTVFDLQGSSHRCSIENDLPKPVCAD